MTNNSTIFIDKYLTRIDIYLIVYFKILFFNLFVVCFLLIGCSTTQPPVPVIDRSNTDAVGPNNRSIEVSELPYDQSYIVQRGDTLYTIAHNYGVDIKKLLELNNITDPTSIKPGQKISLPVKEDDSSEPTLFALPQQPLEINSETDDQPFATIPQENNKINYHIKTAKVKASPKAIKLPFSEQNLIQLKSNASLSSVVHTQKVSPVVLRENIKIETAPEPVIQKTDRAFNLPDAEWTWPTTGTLISPFSKNSKGLKISGQAGQPILASAAGEVVYSGHGLRGYGNLIIIKHNNTFLSAYAHNSRILVKEGETVVKGQKIAEMGSTDTDTIQLHFEIRKNGKPVDPLQYLPNSS